MSSLRAPLRRQLHSISLRLLIVNLLIVAVPIVGIGFARLYEREMLRSQENDMIHQAQLLRQLLLADPQGLQLEQRGPALRAAARDTRTRIRLLDANGHVQADSHRLGPPEGPEPDPPEILNEYKDLASSGRSMVKRSPAWQRPAIFLHQRSEIQSALQGKYGANTRLYRAGDRLFLFSALPIIRANASHDKQVLGVVYVTRSTNPARAAMYRLRSRLFKVLLIALLITAVLSIFFAATISRPLAKLTRRAHRIADGDRSESLSLKRQDEIGDLARAFARMTQKLDGRAEEMATLAANISHEFKSPLTAIRGAAELLLEGAAEDPQARARFIENILQDAHRLDRLVTRLLELSRFEADPIPDENVDLFELLKEICKIKTGQAEIKLDFRATHPHIWGKRAQLLSAFANLIENARQHARPASEIEVQVDEDPDEHMLRISVFNQGKAISAANLDKIWQRFFTTRPDSGGTGLGLAIVASVVRAHGGEVEVQSPVDGGTRFDVRLKLSKLKV